MAKITGEPVRNDDGTIGSKYNWTGMGVASVPWHWCRGIILVERRGLRLGNLSLRVVGYERFPRVAYVAKNNRVWPIWWTLFRLGRFAKWFERNLRMTAAVWGLLQCEIGASPRWRDFILWRWLTKRKANETQ